MLNLSAQNICLNATAPSKNEAISLVAKGLVANGNVAQGYEAGMLAREQQTSTFLGNGIAIPHGTLDTRDLVQQTGVQIYQFPQGIEWGEGNIAYVVIGIAAKSDEHLALLRQLTTVLSDEAAAETLAKTKDLDLFVKTLKGEKSKDVINNDLLYLDEMDSLFSLVLANTVNLQKQGRVTSAFSDYVSRTVKHPLLSLGNDVWLCGCGIGNLANGIAVGRTKVTKKKAIETLITVSAVDDSLNPILVKLLNEDFRKQLATASSEQILALFSQGEETAKNSENPTPCNQVVGTFTVRNDNGLHARPSAVLVQTLKPFEAKVTVENLDRQTAPANAKSTMKVVALGASQAHRLRFVAEGADAQQAIEALAKAFAEGLGEEVSFVPSVEDVIEQAQPLQAVSSEPNSAPQANAEGQFEATFTIQNEHGLHARPSAVLVNEVKKYNATIVVQNLDRNSELVSAKSLMKIVALGVTKGTRLRFVATGDEAEKALAGIGEAIAAGLGEAAGSHD